MNEFERTELLLGSDAVGKLKGAHVAVFGVGGVGGYVVEALARSGVGELTLVDKDVIDPTNINRQIIALHSTIGRPKVDVIRERVLDINPEIKVHAYRMFYLPDTAGEFDFSFFDYVIDAVDTVSAKIELVMRADAAGIPVISAMGAGNKLDPTGFEVADISRTSVCPLARVMRRELRSRGIEHLKVVYSKEPPKTQVVPATGAEKADPSPDKTAKPPVGSVSFVPSVCGLILASEVIRDLTK